METDPELASASAAPVAALAVIFPPRPVSVPKQVAAPKKAVASAPVAAKPAAQPLPAVAAAPEKPANTGALQSLLVSLKQELRNAAQI